MPKAPDTVLQLVDTFDRNLDSFKNHNYNETQLRRQFLDPFFEALGWDVSNKAGNSLPYTDVIHEDALKIGSATKAPDYSFRIGGKRIFFVEAKKPSVDIKSDIHPAYQLRRYAWSAKLPLSILTDFEEFAVYDCQSKPGPADKPSAARIFLYSYKDYPDNWQQIASIFSKDAVLKGSFDTFASKKTKKGTAAVDTEFLSEIESWRDILARNIALRNNRLSVYDLNFAVQKTIDRILFLRMCEDRGIEFYGQLLALINAPDIYSRLFTLFERADEKYNSGIFHFSTEKGRPELPDGLSASLKIDDAALKQIISQLYYPQSPYEFSVLPAEILGNVYEQFLGKVIRLTASHQAKIEEKPEVKKAGGVYYTPSYIVDYIVNNTVAKLCENKSPKQIEKIKILDPACGSGSFLIGAYKYLLDYHRDYYIANNPDKFKKQIYQGKAGQYFLTIAEKKRILLNNIFGVDIDSQAVEVTKLSLLLKVLENETQESIGQSLKLFHERALPDLAQNIKCGNSLISHDFYQNQQLDLFDDDLKRKINTFDWHSEFPDIFKNGGFDAVIGNPPYGAELPNGAKDYLNEHYHTTQYKLDTYGFFIEAGLERLKAGGMLGYIVPNTWFDTKTYSKLRKYILTNSNLNEVINLGKNVFDCNVDTALLLTAKKWGKSGEVKVIDASNYKKNELRIAFPLRVFSVEQSSWEKNGEFRFNVFSSRDEMAIFTKMQNVSKSMDEVTEISQGLIPYNTKEMSEKNPYISERQQSKDWKPLLDKGACVSRYLLASNGLYIKFGEWLYTANKPKFYENDKILVQRHRNPSLARRIIATIDTRRYYFKDNLCGIISKENSCYDLRFILGILNSNLMNFYYKKNFTEVSLNPVYLRQLPIHSIDFKNPDDVKMHDKMVSLVEQMLDLNKKLADTKNPDEKTRLQRQITATDSQIDNLVYQLYNLTPDEIKLIEENVK